LRRAVINVWELTIDTVYESTAAKTDMLLYSTHSSGN